MNSCDGKKENSVYCEGNTKRLGTSEYSKTIREGLKWNPQLDLCRSPSPCFPYISQSHETDKMKHYDYFPLFISVLPIFD